MAVNQFSDFSTTLMASNIALKCIFVQTESRRPAPDLNNEILQAIHNVLQSIDNRLTEIVFAVDQRFNCVNQRFQTIDNHLNTIEQCFTRSIATLMKLMSPFKQLTAVLVPLILVFRLLRTTLTILIKVS